MNEDARPAPALHAPPMAYTAGVLYADGTPTLVTLGLLTVHGVLGFTLDRIDATQLIDQLTAARDQLPALDVVRELPPELRDRLS